MLRAIEWARRSRQDLVVDADLRRWRDTLGADARASGGCARHPRNAHREEITDSDFELLVLALMREAGLPEPVLHLQGLRR